ncbi:hypothetical protein VCHA53O466_50258 [Vibrio chagasii]|nr:hypothetical protein VCHA53O466_50258 [Vibrio chagasii]
MLPKNNELFTLPDASTKKLGLGAGEVSFPTFQKPNSKRTFVYRFHEDVSLICGEGEIQDSFMIVYSFESEGHHYFTCEYHTVKDNSIGDTPHIVRIKPFSGKDEDFMDTVIDIVLLDFGLKTSVYGDIILNDN